MSSKAIFAARGGHHAGAAIAFVLAGLSPAAANQLGDEAIKSRVSGKRIYLAAPMGGEFPLFYRADGFVDGSGEAVGLGRLARPTDNGRWWVKGDKLCQKWQTWYEGKILCFTLTELGGSKLRWVQDNGDTGVARIGN
jgi:hypothetical protein